jgi:hypothetical protein
MVVNVKQYAVQTTQITIRTAATSEDAAIQAVMAYERCPRSAILSIKEL